MWRLMWTTSMYWALKGFCSREHSSQRHTNSFFSPWMCSLLMCCVESHKRSSLPGNKRREPFTPTCTFTSAVSQPLRAILTHTHTRAPGTPPSSITLDSYCASVSRTWKPQKNCFFRLRVFLKKEEPAAATRKSIYLPFFLGLKDQDGSEGNAGSCAMPQLNICFGQTRA